jgi:hypothetical protein
MAFAHLLEEHDLGGLDRGGGLQLAPVLARIDPLSDQAPVLGVQLAGAFERNILDRPYANPPLLAGDRVTAGPRLGGRVADLDVEPMLIVVLARTERLGLAGAGLLNL